jgi:hypothetical protein
VFGVVFATDTNSIVLLFVVNTTNTDLEKIFQKLSTTGEAEQSVAPDPPTGRICIHCHQRRAGDWQRYSRTALFCSVLLCNSFLNAMWRIVSF